jgi:hypothetical protein
VTNEVRLAKAIGRFAQAGAARFDTRAAIATVLTLALVWLGVTEREIPRELALAYATILGWYFPRPAETAARG